MARIFYSGTLNASSWALRAWLALRASGIPFEEVVVDIRVPQRYPNLAAVRRLSPPGAVPVLVDDGHVIFDSLAIMEYANDLANGRLLPGDMRARARARSWLAWQHAGLSSLCSSLSFESAFYREKRAISPIEMRQAHAFFDVVEAELASHAGEWIAGAYSLADMALVPTVCRLTSHVDDLAHWPLSDAWCHRLLSQRDVKDWLDRASALPEVRLPGYDTPDAAGSSWGPPDLAGAGCEVHGSANLEADLPDAR